MNSRKRTTRLISAALTSLFLLNQTMMISAFATNITNPTGIQITGQNGVYTIDPTAVIKDTDIGLRKYHDFELSQGDIANLIFKYGDKNINSFVNLVDNQIKINGVVNTMRDNNFYNGRAIFVSPNGMIVGASGVLNVGSLGVYTPNSTVYEHYKNNPSSNLSALKNPNNAGDGIVKIDGKVLAAQDIDIVSSKINVPGKMIANGTGVVSTFDDNVFEQLVNTSSMKSAKNMSKNGGAITFTSVNGTDVSGSVMNHGKGVTSVNNLSTRGIILSGNIGSNGNVELTNRGSDGILIASSGKVDSNQDVLMNDTSVSGIAHKGLTNADNNVYIKENGGNVVIGDRTSNNNYITAGKNIDINVKNGSILNYESQQADARIMHINAAKTLLKAGGDLNMDVTDGTIGLNVGDNCTGGYCTGISNAETTRDYAKSINGHINGAVTAKTTDSTAVKQNNFVINYAAVNSDMNIDNIDADGRVILTTDYNQNDGITRYNINNASKNAAKPNVQGYGLSLIASKNIGTENAPLTFNQTQPGVLATKSAPVPSKGYGMDVLANENINIKGLDDKYSVNNVCSMISREGELNAEFAGNTYIDEVTAEKDMNIIARGKSLEINHLGTVPRTPVDYFGPRTNGLADNPNLPNGGYTGVGETDSIPNNATVKALDINKTVRPNGTDVDGGYYGYADSVVRINDGKLDKGQLDVVADNIYANGVATHLGKDGFSKEPDPSTNKIEGISVSNGPDIPTGHAVRPEDVTGIGRDEHERNYYYNPGDGDGVFGEEQSHVDEPKDGIVDATPLEITDAPTPEPTPVPTVEPTAEPTVEPSVEPTVEPTPQPTEPPTAEPTSEPTSDPTTDPTTEPTPEPTEPPTVEPTLEPTEQPTTVPTSEPTPVPTTEPTTEPTTVPTTEPTTVPTTEPTTVPTTEPTTVPTTEPTTVPTTEPTTTPTTEPTTTPTTEPTTTPTTEPTQGPTVGPDNDTKLLYKNRIDEDNLDTIDKRQYVRYTVSSNKNPISLERNDSVDTLLDVSRGGVAVRHDHNLKVGDIIPIHMKYGSLDIKANAKVVSATNSRAGAEFVNLDQATANQLLYLNMVLDEVNKISLK